VTRAVRGSLALPAGITLLLAASTAQAQTVSRESDIGDLRLGQKIMVDDGSCPTGQIKEVQGSQMTSSGIAVTRKCIQRLGTKRR